MTDRFLAALKFVLENEGGLVDDSDDHGGLTNKGITIKSFISFFYPGKPVEGLLGDQEVRKRLRNITDEEVKYFYHVVFWQKNFLDNLPSPLADVVFDQAINCGSVTAIKRLQKIVGVTEDGLAGSTTMNAAQLAPMTTAREFIEATQLFYVRLAQKDIRQVKFLSGWISRSHKYYAKLLDFWCNP
jgi:lysozyme family protein